MSVDIDMSEVRALAATLDLKSEVVAVKAAKAVKDAADLTKQEAVRNAPVLTGALRDSIRVTGSRLTRRVSARVRYGIYVEFGTSDTAPQPFLYPASYKGEAKLMTDLVELAAEDW